MFLRIFTLSLLAITLSACNISGSGQKGPFKTGSEVTSSQLDKQASAIASTTIRTQINDNQGHFSIHQIPWNGWTEIVVSGQYFDEFNNTDSDQALTLNTITRKDRRFDKANVHLFSHLAAARIKQHVADGKNRNNAWRDTQTEMKQLFGLDRVSRNFNRGVEQLSVIQGSGRYRRDNANLLLFSGSFLATGGDATTLQSLTDDFADDAQINGVGSPAFNEIAVAGNTAGLLQTLSQNLSRNGASNPPNVGDMQELPTWVNTDGGETDITPNVTGRIRGLNGTALSGVLIEIIATNGRSLQPPTKTDDSGDYSLTLESDTKYTLIITKEGFSKQIKTFRTLSSTIKADFTLIETGIVTNFSQDRDFKAIGKFGTSVEVTANSFDNAAASEIVEISTTTLDKLTLNNTNALPGNFAGQLTGDITPTPLNILGAAEFNFVNTATNIDINLAADKSALITLPLLNLSKSDGSQVIEGEEIPVFSLDETTGIWVQEGNAKIITSDSSPTGLAALATVSHFSWWSIGFKSPVAFANISIASSISTTGTVMLKARTDADVSSQPDVTRFEVGQTITTTFPGWNNTETCFWAEILDNGNVFTTPEECVTATFDEGETFEIILGSGVIPPLGIQAQAPLKSILGLGNSSRILAPISAETTVDYSITSGDLPDGVSLNKDSNTTAIISGSPTEVGTFNLDITAVDSDGIVVVIPFIYEVTDVTTTPVFVVGFASWKCYFKP